jgi:hypothetical protein
MDAIPGEVALQLRGEPPGESLQAIHPGRHDMPGVLEVLSRRIQ